MLVSKNFRHLTTICWIILCSGAGWAQYPSLRVTDTRTSVPRIVMGDRKDWGADLAFGGNFNRGNADVDYIGTNADLFKSWTSATAYLSGSMIYNTFNGKRTLNQGALTGRYDHKIAGPWKVFAFSTNAYNEFTRLNYRATNGVGPWYDFAWGPLKDGASLAMVYEYENFQGSVYNRDGRVSFRNVSQLPISETADIRTDFFYIPRIDQIGDYRIFAEISAESLIWKQYLGLKLSWIDEYQNRPQFRIKPNDTMWLTSLTLHFGK